MSGQNNWRGRGNSGGGGAGGRGGSRGNSGGVGWRGRGGGGWKRGGWRGGGVGGWRGGGGGKFQHRGASNSSSTGSLFPNSNNATSQSQNDISDYFEAEPACPYLGWKHYLPDVPYGRASQLNGRLAAVMDYYRCNNSGSSINREELFEKKCFTVDMDHMLQVCQSPTAYFIFNCVGTGVTAGMFY